MLALQRRTTPPQKIKSLFGTVLTTHHIDIVSLPISTGSSSSHLYGIRGKAPQDKRFSPFLLIHPRTCLENLKAKVGHIQSCRTLPCTSSLLLFRFMSCLKAGGLWGLDADRAQLSLAGAVPSPSPVQGDAGSAAAD